jgi:hypothetical protein
MIVEVKTYKFKRENWKELFRIKVPSKLASSEIDLPKGFIYYETDPVRDIDIYYLWPLIYLMYLIEIATKVWYFPAKLLFKYGHLKIQEGTSLNWNYFRQISIRKILKSK